MPTNFRIKLNAAAQGRSALDPDFGVPTVGAIEGGPESGGAVVGIARVRREVPTPPMDRENLGPAARLDARAQPRTTTIARAIGGVRRVNMTVAPEPKGAKGDTSKHGDRVVNPHPDAGDAVITHRDARVVELATAMEPEVLPFDGDPSERRNRNHRTEFELLTFRFGVEPLPVDPCLGTHGASPLAPLQPILDGSRDLAGAHHHRIEQTVTAGVFKCAEYAERVRRLVAERDDWLDRVNKLVGPETAISKGPDADSVVA